MAKSKEATTWGHILHKRGNWGLSPPFSKAVVSGRRGMLEPGFLVTGLSFFPLFVRMLSNVVFAEGLTQDSWREGVHMLCMCACVSVHVCTCMCVFVWRWDGWIRLPCVQLIQLEICCEKQLRESRSLEGILTIHSDKKHRLWSTDRGSQGEAGAKSVHPGVRLFDLKSSDVQQEEGSWDRLPYRRDSVSPSMKLWKLRIKWDSQGFIEVIHFEQDLAYVNSWHILASWMIIMMMMVWNLKQSNKKSSSPSFFTNRTLVFTPAYNVVSQALIAPALPPLGSACTPSWPIFISRACGIAELCS